MPALCLRTAAQGTMAAEPALLPEQLARQPDFASDLAVVDAALAARRVGGPSSHSALAHQAADRLADRIMRALAEAPAPVAAIPAPLAPAATAVLRLWLPHVPGAAPAARMCPEVQAVLRPGTRAAAAAFLAEMAARGEAQGPGRGPRPTADSPPLIVSLPLALLAPGGQLPFGKTCRCAVQNGMLVMGGSAPPGGRAWRVWSGWPAPPAQPADPGVCAGGCGGPGGPAGVSKLAGWKRTRVCSRAGTGQQQADSMIGCCYPPQKSPEHSSAPTRLPQLPHRGMPPLALTLLGEGGLECTAVCGLPCLEPAHCVLCTAGASGAAMRSGGP